MTRRRRWYAPDMSTPPTDDSPQSEQIRLNRSERVFAIHATPAVVWRHLRAEIADGQTSDRVRIQHEEPLRQIVFWVRMGWGLEVRYDYRINVESAPAPGAQRTPPYCQVSVEVSPVGLRHAFTNVLALGRGTTPYLLAATQGLANLKETAEADPATKLPPT